MIYQALAAVAESLNEYLKNRYSHSDNMLVISGLITPEGKMAVSTPDKMLLTLVNIEQERLTQKQFNAVPDRPVNLYLYVLFSAYFSEENYIEGLKCLSSTISFFQTNPVIQHFNAPALNSAIDKLCFEIVNLKTMELSQVWGMLGGKYMPSVMYKVRMVPVKDGQAFNEEFTISGLGTSL